MSGPQSVRVVIELAVQVLDPLAVQSDPRNVEGAVDGTFPAARTADELLAWQVAGLVVPPLKTAVSRLMGCR